MTAIQNVQTNNSHIQSQQINQLIEELTKWSMKRTTSKCEIIDWLKGLYITLEYYEVIDEVKNIKYLIKSLNELRGWKSSDFNIFNNLIHEFNKEIQEYKKYMNIEVLNHRINILLYYINFFIVEGRPKHQNERRRKLKSSEDKIEIFQQLKEIMKQMEKGRCWTNWFNDFIKHLAGLFDKYRTVEYADKIKQIKQLVDYTVEDIEELKENLDDELINEFGNDFKKYKDEREKEENEAFRDEMLKDWIKDYAFDLIDSINELFDSNDKFNI